jgi:hypothetical protein
VTEVQPTLAHGLPLGENDPIRPLALSTTVRSLTTPVTFIIDGDRHLQTGGVAMFRVTETLYDIRVRTSRFGG